MDPSSFARFSKRLYNQKDPEHDFTHIERILRLCRTIAPPEADIDLVIQAAHFHGALREETSIRDFLKSQEFETDRIEKIIRTAGKAQSAAKPETLEEQVLHDANILDAVGATGIARAFAKGGYEHQTIRETVEIMEKNMQRELYMPKAKEIGEQRKRFMKRFLKRYEKEL